MTKKMFDLLRSNGIQIDDTLYAMAEQQELRKSKKVEGKVLSILPAASGEYDDKTIAVTLQIKAKGLKNYNAKIMIGEFPNVLPDFGFPLNTYKLSSDTITRVQIKFSAENFDVLKILDRDPKFIATVVCDGLGAESKEFRIKPAKKDIEEDTQISETAIDKLTIRIYWNNKKDGRIEKFIPKQVEKKFENKIEYVYYDKQNMIHRLGIFDVKQIENRYGESYLPNKKDKSIYLVNLLQLQNYLSETVFFRISHNTNTTTDRNYMNIYTLASLLGAMLECSFNDFTSNGFSNSKGESVGGSATHKNGMNGDMRYLRKDKSGKNVHLNLESEDGDPCGWPGMDEERQNQFNDALYKFGWKSMLSWEYNGKLLNHSKPFQEHNHHLHLKNYQIPNFKEVIFTLLLFILFACGTKENKTMSAKKSPEIREALKDSIILSTIHKTNFILGDFDGDMRTDTVQLTENFNNKKYGLRYLFANGERKELFMGETLDGVELTDVFFASIFEVVPKGDTTFNELDEEGEIITKLVPEEDKIILPNDAVLINSPEDYGGGIVYWDGKKFKWVQLK